MISPVCCVDCSLQGVELSEKMLVLVLVCCLVGYLDLDRMKVVNILFVVILLLNDNDNELGTSCRHHLDVGLCILEMSLGWSSERKISTL